VSHLSAVHEITGRDDQEVSNSSERSFYSHYEWCLNPLLSLRDLRLRLREEVERYNSLSVEWQREESRINIYLFVCAIACTIDDYLARRTIDLTPAAKRFPRFRNLVQNGQRFTRFATGYISLFSDKSIRTWRKRWSVWVDTSCRLLTDSPEAAGETIEELKRSSDVLDAPLPDALLRRHMRLPEAFRAQDMAHQDVFTLADYLCNSSAPADRPLVILGLRTAGAYFAPLMSVYLRKIARWPVSWFTIRPKFGASVWEARQLSKIRRTGARLVIIDDYPASGRTFRLILDIVKRFQIPAADITIIAPTHPASPNWTADAGLAQSEGMRVVTMDLEDLHKSRLLKPVALQSLFTEYFPNIPSKNVRINADEQCETINSRLAKHYVDGHHVRLKRVVSLELTGPGERRKARKVFAKSVGWGWLGYHAFLAATRLRGFVPPTFGLRNGLLLTDWIEHDTSVSEAEIRRTVINTIPSYVAARTRALPLHYEGAPFQQGYGWNGCDEIVNILRGAYGSTLSVLKRSSLRRRISAFATSAPALLDGKMDIDEWIATSRRAYKIDFAHHNFGGANLDLVDPAYDLAGAIFEFQLSRQAEHELLAIYARESNDAMIDRRIPMYKLLYGAMQMRNAVEAAQCAAESHRRNESVRRHHQARNYLVHGTNAFCAAWMGCRPAKKWSNLLFFMDLDGVFDWEHFGFAHTTLNGLRSLATLQANGFSIVLNTGRSVADVRSYCETYGIPGGVGEYGSVFFDCVENRLMPLIEKAAFEQLARCRESIRMLPGVFMDPEYEFAVRAYRFHAGRSVGLSSQEIDRVLNANALDRLAVISREADTVVVSKEVSKGCALRVVTEFLGCTSAPTTAIGDSEADVSMLEAAQFAYAPSNCNPAIRKLSRAGGCRIMSQSFQTGLLASVLHRLGKKQVDDNLLPALPANAEQPDTLILRLLDIADQRLARRLVSTVNG